ncbi:hypothetical protein M9H77_31742 [Catharanthus roseus]|uniref:Uncharacterized protein n=1 Tax=Catharanthus roseus TaxID=4058 RepID=A0ACC0A205_CATRO|nr:hypothetical protein M9H77_31742 [Catharanthus roseus]
MPLYNKPKTNGDWIGMRRALEKTTFENERIKRLHECNLRKRKKNKFYHPSQKLFKEKGFSKKFSWHPDRVFKIWSKRIRTLECWHQKSMPYHLAILCRPVLDGERGMGEARLEERAQISPFRTDYKKLATLIKINGKLSALYACSLYSLCCSTELGLRFIRQKAFCELLKAIERVPNADGDFGYRADAAKVTGNLMVLGR